jgi:hypothetical protein
MFIFKLSSQLELLAKEKKDRPSCVCYYVLQNHCWTSMEIFSRRTARRTNSGNHRLRSTSDVRLPISLHFGSMQSRQALRTTDLLQNRGAAYCLYHSCKESSTARLKWPETSSFNAALSDHEQTSSKRYLRQAYGDCNGRYIEAIIRLRCIGFIELQLSCTTLSDTHCNISTEAQLSQRQTTPTATICSFS